jgi:hypothetical protein
MSIDSNFDQMRQIARNEVQNFAQEFLPSIEETLHFMEKSKLLESQVKVLETKITNMRGLIQSSMIQLEEVTKQLSKKEQPRSKRGQIIGESPSFAFLKQKECHKSNCAQMKRNKKVVNFDKKEIEKKSKQEIDFYTKLQGKENEKENKFEQSTVTQWEKKKPKKKEKKESLIVKLTEKRIKKLERDQKKFEELVQEKLDLVICEVQKVSIEKKRFKLKQKQVCSE